MIGFPAVLLTVHEKINQHLYRHINCRLSNVNVTFSRWHGFIRTRSQHMDLWEQPPATPSPNLLNIGQEHQLLTNEQNEKCPALVVVPPGLLRNWQREFERWAPALKFYVYHGPKRTLPENQGRVPWSKGTKMTEGWIDRQSGKTCKKDVVFWDQQESPVKGPSHVGTSGLRPDTHDLWNGPQRSTEAGGCHDHRLLWWLWHGVRERF